MSTSEHNATALIHLTKYQTCSKFLSVICMLYPPASPFSLFTMLN